MSRRRSETVPITSVDLERFHRNAWAAIKRRGGSYIFDELGAGLQTVFIGGVPLIGLIWWNWFALQLLAFYLVGSWIGIVCDFAKLCILEKYIKQWGETFYEDWHVWVVADSLRVDAREAPRAFIRAKYEPWSGVLVDFACGGISTALICIGLIRSPGGIEWNALADKNLGLWLAGVSSYQMLFTFWEIWEHKSGRSEGRKVKVAVGLRGLGLFLFMFLLVFITNGFEQTGPGVTRAMLAMNCAIVLWGLSTMLGPFLVARQTRWLEKYMLEREAGSREGR